MTMMIYVNAVPFIAHICNNIFKCFYAGYKAHTHIVPTPITMKPKPKKCISSICLWKSFYKNIQATNSLIPMRCIEEQRTSNLSCCCLYWLLMQMFYYTKTPASLKLLPKEPSPKTILWHYLVRSLAKMFFPFEWLPYCHFSTLHRINWSTTT